MIAISLLLGTPFFIFFGWLSDRIGRLKIILAGCLIAALTYFPLFQGLTHYVNPALERVPGRRTRSRVAADATATSTSSSARGTNFTDCDRAKDFLTKAGLSFESVPGRPGQRRRRPRSATIELDGWDSAPATRRR